MPAPQTHTLRIAGISRELPLFQVAPGLRIAVLNMLGDTELVEVAAEALAESLTVLDYQVLVTAEAKSIPLAHALGRRTGKPWVVLRKQWKPYMGEALEAATDSITTGKPQTLYLDEKDRAVLDGRAVILLDDVISTGSTVAAMRGIVARAGARVIGVAAACTEGDADAPEDVIALAHLPLFRD